ncbi:TetR family transcriptional regulator [Teredinibacter sp. KSP-S5-2]|uniref:TetR family transcriptional regulator n=1 Tax=Teredinibacter sp. KSP-S5-2 TaxID=3034506 RepID=UPI002934A065|nr:TetR family transcriptional regulator [Teredinibacter sp. KSP-S5-2]WNO08932.1 TetR family transcriptional regulator [Teredinibacter sp. KSP-S5-2]
MSNPISSRGRPKDTEREEKARQSLLNVTQELLKHKPYSEISIREIAGKAELNSAMISYYFGGKEGLFFHLIERGIGDEAFGKLDSFTTDDTVPAIEKLYFLIETFVGLHQNHPWLSRLVIDQIILKKGKLRDLFIKNIVERNNKLVIHIIDELKASGFFREDLSTEYARTSLISLMAFPFIAAPMLKEAVGVDPYKEERKQWAQHTFKLFIQGCQNSSGGIL